MLFSSIPGLSSTKKTLIKGVVQNHVAHAQLFWGLEGTANLSLALAYGRYILCEDKQENDACGVCQSCNLYNKLNHPDLHFYFPLASIDGKKGEELKNILLKDFKKIVLENPYLNLGDWATHTEADNKQFAISVEEGRAIIQNSALKPFMDGYKIFIIWLPELMNTATANSILKILEEPPARTLFLMVSSNMEKLLQTIISRCQVIKIPLFEDADILNYLIENQKVDSSKAKKILTLADGNLNKALFLVNHQSSDYFSLVSNWLRLCYGKKYAEILKWTDEVAAIGRENQKNLLQYAIQLLHEILMGKAQNQNLVKLDGEELEFVTKFGQVIAIEKIDMLNKVFNDAFAHIERNGNAKIVFFDSSIKLSTLLKS